MKKQSRKASSGIGICIVLISILLIALIIVYYLGFINDAKQQSQEAVVNNASEVVPTSDLVTLFYEDDNRLFYAYIEDGCLFYINDSDMSFATSSNVQKYTDLTNIVKMETYNVGTGVNPVPFLITEEGQVYYIDYYVDRGIKVELYEGLSSYAVKDIISHSGEMSSVFEILLKDGTTKNVECENYLK